MKKLTRKIAALLTAAVVALTAVTLPDTGGLIPQLLTSASAAYSYTVTFDAAGGSPVPETQTVESGGTITKPDDPVKEGYTFEGWYIRKHKVEQVDNTIDIFVYFEKLDFDTDTITSDTFVCAKWSRPAETVSFMDADGSTKTVDAVPLDGQERLIGDGWYVVDQDINYTNTLDISGDVNIILSDNHTMKFGSEGEWFANESIYTSSRGALSFYVQSEGENAGELCIEKKSDDDSGLGVSSAFVSELNIYGGKYNLSQGINAGDINITAGTFNCTNTDCAIVATNKLNISGGDLYIRTSRYGINSPDINISGGNFDIKCGVNGIYSDNKKKGTPVTITGGTFKIPGNGSDHAGEFAGLFATGDIRILGGQYDDLGKETGLYARGIIYFGYENIDDYIKISSWAGYVFSFNAGLPGASDAIILLKPFVLEGTDTAANVSYYGNNIKNKKLVPKTQTVTVVAKDTENNDVKSAAAGKKTVVYGGKAELTSPDVDGYVFRGWYNGDTLLSSDYEYTTDEIKQDTTIKALYELISATGASSLFGPLKNGLYTLESKTYTLTEDIYTLGRIYVPNGVNAVIDLNGHTIDRGLNQFKEGGGVVGVAAGASLTVKNGTIKGGARGKGNGGGFNVNGELILNSVIIEDCKAEHAGGGIYINGANASVIMRGNSIVKNNTAGTYGSGIYVGENAELTIEGKPVVIYNARTNVYLTEGRKISFLGELDPGTEVGITYIDEGKSGFTSGYSSYVNTPDPSEYFFGDNGDDVVLNSGEVRLAKEYIKRSWNSTTKKVEEETLYVDTFIPFSEVKVTGDNTVDLTDNQWYVLTEDTLLSHKVRVFIGANILLCDGKELTCEKGIVVENTNTLCIYGQKNGTGRLVSTGSNNSSGIGCDNDNTEDTAGIIKIYGGDITATGDSSATGIGGGYKIDNGTIEIYGGTVTANGGFLGAGIGIGSRSNVLGNISIMGGTVNAVGGKNGAGIGGGSSSPIKSGKITIKGGTVNATGRGNGAGIGSGYNSDAKFDLTISGGTVKAISVPEEEWVSGSACYGGAGIGTGGDTYNDFNGTITITGGKVDAYGSGSSKGGNAGIGTAIAGNMNGTITITGGEVTAIGYNGAAAIGAGTKGRGAIGSLYGGKVNGTISILGGTVKAKNNTDEDFPSAYIGHGYDKGYEFDGTLILGDNMKVQNMDPSDRYGKAVSTSERISACRIEHTEYNALLIIPCDHPGSTYVPDPNDNTMHIMRCAYCKHSETEPHQPDSTGKCILCGFGMELTKVARVEPTCTEPGNVEYFTDKDGNYYMEDPEKPGSFINVTARMTDLAPLGHDLSSEIVNEIAATCEDTGHYTVRETCSRCDYLNDTVVDVPELGHDYAPAVYTWNDDYTACEAKKVCRNDETHVITANGTVTSEVTKEATVSETGEIKYTATFTEPGFTTQTVTVETAKILPVYGEPVYTWAADYSWCKGVRTSVNGAPELTETTTLIHIAGTAPATCTSEGLTKYVAEFENEYFADQSKTITTAKLDHTPDTEVRENVCPAGCDSDGRYDEVIYCSECHAELERNTIITPATGHKWGVPTYSWSEDNSTVTATAICSKSGCVNTVTVDTTSETVEATFDAPGSITYTAEFPGIPFITQTKTVEIPQKTAEYGEPVYTWANDCSSCTAERASTNGGDPITEEAVITSVTTPATCTTAGETVYTATFANPLFADQTKKVAINKLGHTDGAPVEENKVEATCEEDGSYDLVTYCTVCKAETGRIHNVIVKSGHNYANPVYKWADDNSTVTAVITCVNDGSHTVTETVDTSFEVITAPTASKAGKGKYTAEFESELFTKQTKETEIEKLVPEYNEPTYEWALDFSSVTGTRTCTDPDVAPITATSTDITETTTKTATCAAKGEKTYTAVFADPAFTTQTRTVQIPKLTTHEPGKTVTEVAAAATCTESGIEYDTVYCKVCDTLISRTMRSVAPLGHTRGEPVIENETAATCTTDGSYDEVVTCTVCKAEISRDTIVVKAFGHDWCEPTYTWATDNSTVTAKRVCAHDSTHIETETVNTKESVLTEATATENGVKLYTATFENKAFTKQQKKVDIPANGYDQLTFELEYETVVYDGTEKMPKVTVKNEDGNELSASEYIVTYSDNVNVGTASVKIEDNNGGDHVFETAVLNFTITKADVKIVTGKAAYNKTYGDPDFIIDGCSASFNAPVTFSLKSGGTVISLNDKTVSVLWTGSAVITASVAATANYNAASAEITVNVAKADSPAGRADITLNVDNSYTKVGDIAAPAGWAWTEPDKELPEGEPVITTAEYSGADAECYENTTITATITRANHTHTQSAATRENVVEATCTEGGSYDEIIRCARCGAVLSSVHRTTDPLGHIWGTVVYTWAPDNSTCTASRICERDRSHTESETVGTTCVVLEQPTEFVNGKKLYTAVFENSTFKKQTMTAVIPSFTHTHTPGDMKRENVVEPTCTVDGSYDEVIRCTECGEIISTIHRVTKNLGHNFVNGVCTRCGATEPDYRDPNYGIPIYVPTINTNTGAGTGNAETQTVIGRTSIRIETENRITGKKYTATLELNDDVFKALNALPENGNKKNAQIISVELGKKNAGLYANLYHRDAKTGKLTFADSVKIGKDGKAKLKFAYPPEYTIIIDDHSHLISAVPTATGVRFAWEPVENAESYTVYVKKNGKLKKLTTTSKTSLNIKGLKNGTTYEFTVRYKVAGKLSEIADSYTISFTAAYRPVVTARSANGSVSLSWNAVAGAEKYKVCKYVDGKLRTLSEVDGTAVKITGTKSGKTYTFAVKALVNGKWTKVYSGNLVSVTAK